MLAANLLYGITYLPMYYTDQQQRSPQSPVTSIGHTMRNKTEEINKLLLNFFSQRSSGLPNTPFPVHTERTENTQI